MTNPSVGPRCPACRAGLTTHEPLDPHCDLYQAVPDVHDAAQRRDRLAAALREAEIAETSFVHSISYHVAIADRLLASPVIAELLAGVEKKATAAERERCLQIAVNAPRNRLHMTDAHDAAKIMGYATAQDQIAAAIESGQPATTAVVVERTSGGYGVIRTDLYQLTCDSLRDLLEIDDTDRWMNHPNPILQGDVPAELVKTKAGFLRVRAVVDGLKDGVVF